MRIYWPEGVRKPKNREDALVLMVESPEYRARIQQRFDRLALKPLDPDDCWGWQGSVTTLGGYPRVSMFKGVEARGNRVSFVLTHGRVPEKSVVAHSCDNPVCCNPRHLFEASHGENIRDAVSKGRHVPFRAIENRRARRLSDEDVRFIRQRYVKGSRTWGQACLGKMFGLTQGAVRLIVIGATYRTVEGPPAAHPRAKAA